MEYTLDYYKNKRWQTERQINDQKSKNASIQQQIEQLEAAYDQLGNIKRFNQQNAQAVIDKAKLSKVADGVEWRGDFKKQFDSVMNNQVSQAARDFYNSIDEIHDEIGTALDRKRGEYDTGSQILNGLNRSWNYFTGIIRNWVN